MQEYHTSFNSLLSQINQSIPSPCHSLLLRLKKTPVKNLNLKNLITSWKGWWLEKIISGTTCLSVKYGWYSAKRIHGVIKCRDGSHELLSIPIPCHSFNWTLPPSFHCFFIVGKRWCSSFILLLFWIFDLYFCWICIKRNILNGLERNHARVIVYLLGTERLANRFGIEIVFYS